MEHALKLHEQLLKEAAILKNQLDTAFTLTCLSKISQLQNQVVQAKTYTERVFVILNEEQ